jgi:hypothetical protein
MIPNDQPLRGQTIKRMLNFLVSKIQAETDRMTGWEKGFILSVADYFERKSDLSLKQTEILERIYDAENR